MSKIIDNLTSCINAVQKRIAELEQLGMKIVDEQASELIRICKERTMKRVDGIEWHYNSHVRFSYKKSAGRVYFYLTKLIINSKVAVMGHPVTKVIKKRKTYPYYTDSQLDSNSKDWEFDCLYYTREILADITKSISHLKQVLRGLESAKRTIRVREEKAQLDSAYSKISEFYIGLVNKMDE